MYNVEYPNTRVWRGVTGCLVCRVVSAWGFRVQKQKKKSSQVSFIRQADFFKTVHCPGYPMEGLVFWNLSLFKIQKLYDTRTCWCDWAQAFVLTCCSEVDLTFVCRGSAGRATNDFSTIQKTPLLKNRLAMMPPPPRIHLL